MFYALATATVIFTMKTSLEVFSLRREDVWTCSVLGDCICEMKTVTESGQQGSKPEIISAVLRPLVNLAPTGNRTPKTTWSVLGPPYRRLL